MQIVKFKPNLWAAVLIPLLAGLLQWFFWAELQPKTWIFLYPAVFLSARYGGFPGGMIATCLSVVIGNAFFVVPEFSFHKLDYPALYSTAVFFCMGGLFSVFFDRLHRSTNELFRLQSLELEINQRCLTQALDAANAGIWEWDLQTNANRWTENLWGLYGLQPHALPASYETWLTTVHADDRETTEAAIKHAVENNQALNVEWRLAAKIDGQERWLMSRGQPDYNETGDPAFYRGIVLDISESKRIEQQLQDNEARLRFMLETLKVGAWELDLQSFTASYSLEHAQIFGYTGVAADWNYQLFLEHVLPEERTAVDTCFKNARAVLSDWNFECRIRRADGEIRWISAVGAHKFDKKEQPLSMVGIVQDITERKQRETKARFVDMRYRALVDQAAPDGLFIHNHNGNFVEVNKQACESVGYSKQELLRMNVLDLEQDFDLPRAQAAWSSLQPEAFITLLGHHKRKDGGMFPVEVRSGLLIFENQRLYIAQVRDISERVAAERSLKESEARYREMFESNPHPMWVYDTESLVFLSVNDAAVKHYGYSRDEFLNLTIKDIRPAEEVQRLLDAIAANTFGANQVDIWRHRCKNGREILVEMSVHPMHFGGHQAMVALVHDVTERTQTLHQLHKLSMAIEQNPESVVITDLEAKLEYANKAFLRNSGYSAEEVLGKNISLLKSGKTSAKTYVEFWQTLQNGEVWKGEFINRRKDGSEYIDFAIVSPIRDESGHTTHYVGIQEDITEKKKINAELDLHRHHLEKLVQERTEELANAKSLAEAGNAAKSTFLSNMSHEIRTPMNAVLGLCYLLEQRPLDEDSHMLVKKINSAGRALMGIINDILDFSKIEAGRLEIEMAPFHLMEMLDQLADLMSASALHKNLELTIIPPLDADALIGDGPRLKQILINLLSNAIKFTEEGEVELRIGIESEQAGQLKLRFSVKDTGIGIPAEQQQDLFSAFTQADNSISRRFGGTGLGLTICQQLVHLLGGELHVKSTAGEGSEFWFVLPLQRDKLVELIPANVSNLHILVVDDHQSAREALLLTAENLGWSALAVDSGQAAVLQFMDSRDKAIPYDVLLIDWKMPGLDGIATAQLIRKLLPETGREPGRTPIILMVTAYSLKELQLQSTPDLTDGLLSKPITPSSLYNAVCRALVRREQDSFSLLTADSQTKGRRIPGVRVLVVDDSEINREVAQRILQADGATVNLAEDGQEALAWLDSHADQVDIVLMDIQMPRLDGYEATRRIRQLPNCAELPILALTAGAFKSLQDQALAAGMNDFIAKPFDVAQMMAMIQRWTAGKTASSLEASEAALPAFKLEQKQASTTQAAAGEQGLPGVKLQTGLNYWQDDAIFKSYLSRFVSTYRQAGTEILEANTKADGNAAKTLAHKLKGVAGALGLNKVAKHCLEVEVALEHHESCQTQALSLQAAIDEVVSGFEEPAIMPAEPEISSTIDYTHNGKHIEILDLLKQLIDALSLNNAGSAEALLAKLEILLSADALSPIKAQIPAFNFREAEALTQALLENFKQLIDE